MTAMEQSTQKAVQLKLERTAKALEKNNFRTYVVGSCEEARQIAAKVLQEGEVISSGGSATLEQTGIKEMLKSGSYVFMDKDNKDTDTVSFYEKALTCDVYFTSSNAITEAGELYNVDGFGNRVSVFSFGPKRVIVVAGFNKIVSTMQDAVKRVKMIAAPTNCIHLGKKTPCAQTGCCIAADGAMTEGCKAEDRICRHYAITAAQRPDRKRIEIILVAEALGY